MKLNSQNMPTLQSPHIAKPLKPTAPTKACQRVCLSKRTDERKESTIAQQWLYVMRAKVLK